jgi:hypothetical protein
MTHKHRTKDENFILSLYEEAKKTGDVEQPIDRYQAGKHAGLNPKAVDAICKLLIQANFIRKSGEVEIYLTSNGELLIERLLIEGSN